MIRAMSFCVVMLLVVVVAQPIFAQSNPEYQFEIAIISSLSFVSERQSYDYRGDWYGGGNETEEYLLIPGNSPGLRLTFRTRSPILVDAGVMLIASGTDYNSARVDRFMLELGLGVDLGRKGSRIRPFVGAIGGGIMSDNSAFRNYVGGQGGVRFFVRDYAALRLQIGHRTTLNDERYGFKVTEIAAGIGFLL